MTAGYEYPAYKLFTAGTAARPTQAMPGAKPSWGRPPRRPPKGLYRVSSATAPTALLFTGGLKPCPPRNQKLLTMKINDIIWPKDRVDHIALHKVGVDEVEEVCFGQSLILTAKHKGENPVYYILGQTKAGRYLFCVMIHFPDGRGYPVTARDMTQKEKSRYKKWRDK